MPIELEDTYRLYTLDELVEKLHMNKQTLYKYVTSGKLKGIKKANRWYVATPALKEFFGAETGPEPNTKTRQR